jgi:DNA-binding transcriptional ArsR family regulator
MRNYLALNRIFRGLANPTRRHIVEQLTDGDASVTVLAEPLPISLASVMRQIQMLESAGMIRTHKIAQVRTCWLEPQPLELLDAWVTEQRSRWERRQSRG